MYVKVQHPLHCLFPINPFEVRFNLSQNFLIVLLKNLPRQPLTWHTRSHVGLSLVPCDSWPSRRHCAHPPQNPQRPRPGLLTTGGLIDDTFETRRRGNRVTERNKKQRRRSDSRNPPSSGVDRTGVTTRVTHDVVPSTRDLWVSLYSEGNVCTKTSTWSVNRRLCQTLFNLSILLLKKLQLKWVGRFHKPN